MKFFQRSNAYRRPSASPRLVRCRCCSELRVQKQGLFHYPPNIWAKNFKGIFRKIPCNMPNSLCSSQLRHRNYFSKFIQIFALLMVSIYKNGILIFHHQMNFSQKIRNMLQNIIRNSFDVNITIISQVDIMDKRQCLLGLSPATFLIRFLPENNLKEEKITVL